MLALLPSDILCHIYSYVQDEIQDNMKVVLLHLKYNHKWGHRYIKFIKNHNLGIFCLNKHGGRPKILSVLILN